jgi:ATP-dependent helicase/nuclease subunit B
VPSSAFTIPRSAFPPDPRPALYQWLATRPAAGDAVDLARYRAWKALAYSNEASLSPEIARELFPNPLQASVGQIETFATCPFRHFLRYGIRLRDRERASVTGLDLSQVYHEVLDILAGEAIEKNQGWKDLTAGRARELIQGFATSVAQQLRGELMLSSARNRYIVQRIERTLEQVAASLREMESRGRLRPARTGVTFGDTGTLPAYQVRTPGGGELRLSGRIDRIDLLRPNGSADGGSADGGSADGGSADGGAGGSAGGDAPAVVAFDYKLSAGPLPLGNLYHGLSLQLLTYLLVLQANGEQLVGKPLTPAAAFYYQVLRGLSPVDHPDDAVDPSDPRFHLRHKPRGVFDGKFFDSLDAEAAPGKASNVLAAHLKKDGQFAALLSFVHARLGRIGDQIMAGEVGLHPYRIGRKTPCPQCEFRPVCRFEPGVNSYRHLVPLRRLDALEKIAGGGEEEGERGNEGGGGRGT